MFYQRALVAQIIDLPSTAHKIENLLNLAPLQWCEAEFPAKKEGVDMKAAVNACIRACSGIGKYSPDRVRGRGVFVEDGSVVAHLGDRLLVDGRPVRPFEYRRSPTIWKYRDRIDLGHFQPLSSRDARELHNLCSRLDSDAPDMARIFAGWIAVAPICGALRWRPYIWPCAEVGSGKSFALTEVAGGLLNELAVKVAGSSTEAGLRQELGGDALPVLFDEAEGKDVAAAVRLESILELVRAASSVGGAVITKGSSGGRSQIYRVQSAFAFASVDSAIRQTADASRFIQLRLRGLSAAASDEQRERREEDRAEFRHDLHRLIEARFGELLFLQTLGLGATIKPDTIR